MDLTQRLRQFTSCPEDDRSNYNLALEFDKLGQTSSALSFYLRAAERTSSEFLVYECLIRSALCLRSQGDRNFSYVHQLKHAITVCPSRPEAYFFLCQQLESEKNYYDSYLYACIALSVCDFSDPLFEAEYNYHGKEGLEFYKAACGLHWDKIAESKEILQRLLEETNSESIKAACRSNLDIISR